MQTAPSKRSGRAASRPLCSEPAIGCEPTNRPPRMPSSCRTTPVLTLPTSVTVASRGRAGAIFSANVRITPIGVQSTQRLDPLAVSSSSVETEGKRRSALAADSFERVQTRKSHFGRTFLRASASEPPMSPGPKMATVLRGQGRFYSCKGT
jgi:hypothetical protein